MKDVQQGDIKDNRWRGGGCTEDGCRGIGCGIEEREMNPNDEGKG
jgi:hypothetical protein